MTYSDDRRAEEARGLLNSALLKEIFKEIEAEALEKALRCSVTSDRARFRHIDTIRITRDVFEKLESLVGVHGINSHFNSDKG